ncbi:hypothetical protein AB3N02_22090 [Priestia aryabhattai]|uniref:hypothetical protein n=1 Tax=Priestia aryabhattai TaxID=412384 RepID=UPI0039A013C5
MNTDEEVRATQERIRRWHEEQKVYKEQLAILYPVNKIKNINTKHIRKIGNIMGMYSNHTKREYIHHIASNQDFDNPIIVMHEDGTYHLNQDCALIKYFDK